MSDSLSKSNNALDVSNRFEYIPNSNEAYQSTDNGLDPRKMFSIVVKYKWIVLLFLIAGAVAAWIYAETVTPIYESNGTLMITSGDNSPTDELSKIISQTTGYGTSSKLENELQILRSRKFADQVAQNLINADTVEGRTFPILWSESEEGERYRASVGTVGNRIRNGLTFYQTVKEAEAVNVNFKSSSPEEAATIINLTMRNYIDSSTQQNRQATNSTADFLADEKEKVKGNLRDAEQNLRSYMDKTGIVQVNEQAAGMVTQRASTEVELQKVNLQLKAAEETIADLKSQLDRISPGLADQMTEAIGPRIKNAQEMLARYEGERSMILAKNPGVLKRDPLPARLQYLDKQIGLLQNEIRSLSEKLFTSDNEFMGMNTEDRAAMVSKIQSQLVELQLQANQLKSQKQALSSNKREMDAEFNALPQGMIDLAKLQRDVKINEELYVNLSRQYADVSVWRQSQFGFGRIIDQGNVPDAPVSPNKKIFLLLGLMLGGLLSAGYITIREYKDNSVNDVGQLRTMYFPPLTVVPMIEKVASKNKKSFKNGGGIIPQEVVMLQNRSSITAEAIRRLKNNIIFQNGDVPPKSIVVTSPEKGDGKSTVSANLGVAFAEEGFWTLVIDSDFRRPKLHKYFGLPGDKGLANYLNNELSFEDLIKDTDLNSLKVITAGQGVEMLEVLSNSILFKRLLKKMEDVFDIIIIDTPPYGIISDSSALLKYAEATVVVAKYRKTNKGMLFKTVEELRGINANVVSIVLNDFDYRQEVSNYYGDGYYSSLYSNYEDYK